MTRRKQITIERTYAAPLADVWELWTTKAGFESWWGPDGFTAKVRQLDLRPGGVLAYDMIATAAPQIEFMKKAGMPLSSPAKVVYTEVTPMTRLAYDNVIDFVPGVAAYTASTAVELHALAKGVRMVLTLDAMHDEEWTKRAVMGWESQLGKLANRLGA